METGQELGAAESAATEFRAPSEPTPSTASPKATNESKTENRSLSHELMVLLEGTYTEPGYKPDRERQKAVLDNLPEDIVLQLRAHIYVVAKEDEFFSRLRGEPGTPMDNDKVARGEVFEVLAENDPGLSNFQLGDRDPATREMLALMHDPARYNLDGKLGHVRNPDLTTISRTGDGRVVIKRIGEAKVGLINNRGNSQVFDGGLVAGVTNTVQVLNDEKDNLRELGLDGIANLRDVVVERLSEKHAVKPQKFMTADFIEVAPDVEQVLIVPANRDVTKPETLFQKDVLRGIAGESRHERALTLLEETRTTVARAAFSINEVSALTQYLLSKVYEIERDNPKFQTLRQPRQAE